MLGFGTGHKRPAVAKKQSSEKFSRAEQVLERSPSTAIANEIPERSQLGIGKWTVKFKIKIQALLAKDTGKQMFGIEPRTFHSVGLQIAGGSSQDLKDG